MGHNDVVNVAELIEKLQAMPPTATVLSSGWQTDQVLEVEEVSVDRYEQKPWGAWKYSPGADVVVIVG